MSHKMHCGHDWGSLDEGCFECIGEDFAVLEDEIIRVVEKYEHDMERMEGVCKGLSSQVARYKAALEEIAQDRNDGGAEGHYGQKAWDALYPENRK